MGDQETTFYVQLQNCEALDSRDNRGKIHNMAFVLLGLTIGLLRKRDGCLSSIHRSMVNKNAALCLFLCLDNEHVISRGHLPVLLGKVNLPVFEGLLFGNYGIELTEEERAWFAGDGKELRGSIEKGDKRGEALVCLVRHGGGEVLGQSFYNGKKESEKPCLRELLISTGASGQNITADALHLNPSTTGLIAGAGGCFIIGLKKNQGELLMDMERCTKALRPVNEEVRVGKGHGRVERRTYSQYDITGEYVDRRWEKSGLGSLVKVVRERLDTSTGKQSVETGLYISNIPAG
ncbi:MAG: ISAs1 family transposase, partial [bacterium]|nr:ISAs1 family transposase [bacterium]